MSTSSENLLEVQSNKRHRLSIDLDSRAKILVDELGVRSGGITNAELFRRCVALYDAVSGHLDKGGVVVFRHPDGKEERLLML